MGPAPTEDVVSQERSEAVVLRGVDFSETSRIITFLTPGRGRMACLAKGVRRGKRSQAGAFDTFNRLEIVYYWKDSRSVQLLGESAVLDTFGPVKASLEKSVFGVFPLECAGKLAHENEPSEGLYAALVRGLEGLAQWTGPARAHVTWQVVHLLGEAGLGPSLDQCVETGRPAPAARGFAFRGGVTCEARHGDRRVSPEALAALRAMAAAPGTCPTGIGAGDEVFSLMCGYAVRQLDSEFRSLRVIRQLFG